MTDALPTRPPARLCFATALVAMAMLTVEVVLTRFFSVLYHYHLSFAAISLVMCGLTLGGLVAARWDAGQMTAAEFHGRLSRLALIFGGFTLAEIAVLVLQKPTEMTESASMFSLLATSCVFLPGFTAAGAFLALVFARRAEWIDRLYSFDLVGSAIACLLCIQLMRALGGPAVLLVPAAFAIAGALLLASRRAEQRIATGLLALVTGLLVVQTVTEGGLIRLPVPGEPTFERWNEYSRVLVYPTGSKTMPMQLVIDKDAAAGIPEVEVDAATGRVKVEPWWITTVNNIGYRTGRPPGRTAVIGVGGGRDILAAIAAGAERIDAYELNEAVIGLLRDDFAEMSRFPDWPGVNVIHSEGRVGIRTSGVKYDLIQASMTDTFAATSSGGFVLSENGLYTVDGWTALLDSLAPGGILTMTRWYIVPAPAEIERLTAVAVAALGRLGITQPDRHIMLIGLGSPEDLRAGYAATALRGTIVVSPTPFTFEETERVLRICERERMHIIAAPWIISRVNTIRGLLSPGGLEKAVAESPWDISPPTDLRPYFFLQMRLSDIFGRSSEVRGFVLDITFRGVIVLITMAGLMTLFALVILGVAAVGLPGVEAAGAGERRAWRRMVLYFFCIGAGYVMVQLGLHQRTILPLGHPTLALSVVLFSMLLGTGLGARVSGALFKDGRFMPAWVAMVVFLALILAGIRGFDALETIGSLAGRCAAVGAVMGLTGFALGFGFPLGVRLVSPLGAAAVQKAWAVNGAASIAGAALAALLGIVFGCVGPLAAGLGFYVLAALLGRSVERGQRAAEAVTS